MAAILLDGDALAQQCFGALTPRIAALAKCGVIPHLTTILVGDDPASAAYISRKHENCAALGMASDDVRLSKTTTQELLALIATLNADPMRHGILVQLPLPEGIDEQAICEAIAPTKDVDGFHPMNLGRLVAGQPGLLPCTPAGIHQVLTSYNIPLQGARIAIIGRGMLVGRPLAMLLSLKGIDAEITLLHSASRDLAEVTRRSDIVISAAGVPNLISADMVPEHASILGVGISYIDGKMVSDISADVIHKARYVTPPHGSVGAMTRARLMTNIVIIAEATAPQTDS